MADRVRRPAFQFYPADWRKAPELQACGLAARGLWMEMLCIMHEAEPYGHLCVNSGAIDERQLARLVGETPARVKGLLAELERTGVFSRRDGMIYSRRMVRDERNRQVRGAGGAKSLDHPNVPPPKGDKDRGKDRGKDTFQPSLGGSLGGSPSSSSSPSGNPPVGPPAGDGEPSEKRKRKTALPADLPISDTHRQLAAAAGVDLDAEVQHFRDHHAARGSVFLDWHAALCTWLRNARKFNRGANPSAARPGTSDDDLRGFLDTDEMEA